MFVKVSRLSGLNFFGNETTSLNWTERHPNDTQNVALSGRDGPGAVHVLCQYYSLDQKPESLKTEDSKQSNRL